MDSNDASNPSDWSPEWTGEHAGIDWTADPNVDATPGWQSGSDGNDPSGYDASAITADNATTMTWAGTLEHAPTNEIAAVPVAGTGTPLPAVNRPTRARRKRSTAAPTDLSPAATASARAAGAPSPDAPRGTGGGTSRATLARRWRLIGLVLGGIGVAALAFGVVTLMSAARASAAIRGIQRATAVAKVTDADVRRQLDGRADTAEKLRTSAGGVIGALRTYRVKADAATTTLNDAVRTEAAGGLGAARTKVDGDAKAAVATQSDSAAAILAAIDALTAAGRVVPADTAGSSGAAPATTPAPLPTTPSGPASTVPTSAAPTTTAPGGQAPRVIS